MRKVQLTLIPKDIQEVYNIGPIVVAKVSSDVMGGSFEIIRKDGKTITIDAVELTGTGIMVEEL